MRFKPCNESGGSGQARPAPQEAVALARRAAAFVDRPDDQALATPQIARREDARHVGRELAVLRLGRPGVAALGAVDAELVEQRLLRAEEAHGQEHELGGEDALAAGY